MTEEWSFIKISNMGANMDLDVVVARITDAAKAELGNVMSEIEAQHLKELEAKFQDGVIKGQLDAGSSAGVEAIKSEAKAAAAAEIEAKIMAILHPAPVEPAASVDVPPVEAPPVDAAPADVPPAA